MKKFTSILILASVLFCFGCTEEPNSPGDNNGVDNEKKELTIEVSKVLIQANGVDGSQIIVRYGDEELTEGVSIYDSSNNKVDLENMLFKTTEAGTYHFWAAYKTFNTGTELDKMASVTAIDGAVPQLPADSQPNSLSFARRVLIVDFTGNKCPFCPAMINLLNQFTTYKEYQDKWHLAVCHEFNEDDPAYFDGRMGNAVGVRGYPNVFLDMNPETYFGDYNNISAFEKKFKEEYNASEAKAGLSISSALYENTLVIRAGIKASEDGNYRLACWLLEDGIKAAQANGLNIPGDFSTHNNCIRLVFGKNATKDFSGQRYVLKAGETVDQFIMMDVNEKWKTENLHLLLMVSTASENGRYYVNNVIDCPINDSMGYVYAE